MDPLRAIIVFMALFVIVDYANGCGPAAVVPAVFVGGVIVGSILNSGCGPCKYTLLSSIWPPCMFLLVSQFSILP